MKVFLDDRRRAPEGWKKTKTIKDTIKLLETGKVTHLSLDNDLGDEDTHEGYMVLLWIEKEMFLNNFIPPRHIRAHTANPSARVKMNMAIDKIKEKQNEL